MDVLSFAILIMKNKNTEVPNSILETHEKLYKCLTLYKEMAIYLIMGLMMVVFISLAVMITVIIDKV